MYRQLYMGGGQGITSLDAGAPSIKYTGNINPNKPTGPLAPFYEYFDLEKPKPKPESEEALLKEEIMQMASAPDPMAELYNIFLDLKQKGQIPKEMGFEQFKQLMEEQSSSQGGIMDMVPREQALFGGRVNYGLGSSFKKAVKKVTGAVKDVVSSDLGKAALAGAALYYGGGGNLFGLQRAGLSGFSFNNIPGVLQARNFLQGVPLGDGDPRSGGFLSRIGKGITGLSTGQRIGLATTALGGLTGYLASQGMDEQQIEEVKSRPEALKGYLRQYYVNLNPEVKNKPELVEKFVNSQLGEYSYATGGRVKYAKGTDRDQQTMELKDVDPNLRAGPDWYIKRIEALMYEYDMDYDTAAEIAFDSDKYFELMPDGLAKGGRPGYAMGNTAQMAAGIEGLPFRQNQAGVGEVDLRETGGFIPPVGVKEKADDIPAMLSNNEFVFTADAVRGMGEGNVNVGAQRMYDMMKKLEKGGIV
jgi:hypothetical protein